MGNQKKSSGHSSKKYPTRGKTPVITPPSSQTNLEPTVLDRNIDRLARIGREDPTQQIYAKITFESVGGLGPLINSLTETIIYPLRYKEVFVNHKLRPPRGVLFHGPPGTGKTLLACALANECSCDKYRVEFFMRNGPDCLSKWLGESEEQLRQLFKEAYDKRPSIIFFDELDGLAPVRSNKQDQAHTSIVSTLLSIMDGATCRGEVVVIGATNRVDAIDPALRRPGRFDKEFLFTLPSAVARQQILAVHTGQWKKKVPPEFLKRLAQNTVGYSGADLAALCNQAVLEAFNRCFPEAKRTDKKLALDPTRLVVIDKDFSSALRKIGPSCQRSLTSPAQPLTSNIRPLLQDTLSATQEHVQRIFPFMVQQTSLDATNSSSTELNPDREGEVTDDNKGRRLRPSKSDGVYPFCSLSTQSMYRPPSHRPRLLLSGQPGQGQTDYLAPALLHSLEHVPVHTLDVPAIYTFSAMHPEERCTQIFREARRSSYSILYMPDVQIFWNVIGETLRATLMSLLKGLQPSAPILLLATCEVSFEELPVEIQELFNSDEVRVMQNPTEAQRVEYFRNILNQATVTPSGQGGAGCEQAVNHLTQLKHSLTNVIYKLKRNPKFSPFTQPVNVKEVPDYYEIIRQPMDLSTMMTKVDAWRYKSAADFMRDIDLIRTNALQYNPDTTRIGRFIRQSACNLRNTAQAIITTDMDAAIEAQCSKDDKRLLRSKRARSMSPIAGPSSKSDVPSPKLLKMSEDRTRSKKHSSDSHKKPAGDGQHDLHSQSLSPSKSVNVAQLEKLLAKTVAATRGFNIEQCERLYNLMRQCVYRHRLQHNKTQVIKDLETTIVKFPKT